EISAGVDRTFFAILDKAFCRDDKRTYLRLMPRLTPIDVAVFPLLSNKNELKERARALYKSLLDHGLEAFYDESGSIGRRYARVDEIGCPLAITVDFESLEKKDVTLRERDSTRQERVSIERIDEEVRSRLWACRPPT
ncbi:glycine--tRNA ligase, partial [Candidatus Woesearchaeota archaeon CG10_big_fil_rev_8_21_14_0_10_47_5]